MPPSVYDLETVRLRATQPSARAGIESRQAVVSGAGQLEWKLGDSLASFRYEPDRVIALLNQLYAMHFFGMPERSGTRYSVYLREDGRVATRASKPADRPTVEVCVEIGEFKRCVTSTAESQPALDRFAQRLFAEAESLAAQ